MKPSKEITVVVSQKTAPELKAPDGLLLDGNDHLLLVDFTAGRLYRANLADGKLVELARGFGGADGLTRDAKGRIYVSNWRGGQIFVMNSESDKPRCCSKGSSRPRISSSTPRAESCWCPTPGPVRSPPSRSRTDAPRRNRLYRTDADQ
jgi:hypothetical protein